MALHREFACCHEGCMGLICLTPEQERKLRDSHESFRCPMGHSQGFYGKSDEEKKIEDLEMKLRHAKNLAQWRQETIYDLRRELRSRSARIGALRRKLRARA